MNMKKTVAAMLPAFAMMASAAAVAKPTEVTILGTIKGEIGPQFEEAMEAYNDAQSTYELVSMPLDGNAFAKMTSLYAAGNAPTIMVMGQEAAELKDKLLDVSDHPLLEKAFDGTYDIVTDGEKVYGFPITVESFGYLYNQGVLDRAVGGKFDPASINTQDDLKALFDKVAALKGVDAITVSPMDWSLGAHFSNVLFTNQAADLDGKLAAMSNLKSGDLKLTDDTVFNGWIDTFDLMKAYNKSSRAPLAPTYDESALALAAGEAGLWFQGNWAYPMLHELDPDAEFGILPVPVSNDASAKGNQGISVGVPLYFAIDASQSTTAEQEGALDFLNWLFTSEQGMDYYVNQMNFIPVYSNVTETPKDSLSAQILANMQQGKALDWMNMYYPGDAYPAMGASMQKYLAGVIDRTKLAAEFENYWTKK